MPLVLRQVGEQPANIVFGFQFPWLRRCHQSAEWIGRLRLSPHVYNDEADCDRFVAVLRQAMQ